MRLGNRFVSVAGGFALLAMAAFCAGKVAAGIAEDKEDAAKFIGISDWEWGKDTFDTVMLASFVITNNSCWDIKDIDIRCSHVGPSGTVINSSVRTIYDVVPAHGSRVFKDINMGFIHSQASKSRARILDFEFTGLHLPKPEMEANAEREAAAKAAAAARAVEERKRAAAAAEKAIQMVADQRKSAADEATFKFHLEKAEAGSDASQYRIGQLYLEGIGCDRDTNQARAWFEKAAAAGNQDATTALSLLPRPAQ
jgi:hypothetical protein